MGLIFKGGPCQLVIQGPGLACVQPESAQTKTQTPGETLHCGGESRKRSSVRPSVASDERWSMRELPERCLAIRYVLSGPDLQEALMPGVSESRP